MEKYLTKEIKTEMLQGAMKFIAVQNEFNELIDGLQETTPNIKYKKEAYAIKCFRNEKIVGEFFYSVRDGEFYFECFADSFKVDPILKVDDYTINIILVYLMSESLLG